MARYTSPVLAAAAATVLLLSAGGPAAAQPRPPMDARGHQITTWMMQNAARRSAPPPAAAPSYRRPFVPAAPQSTTMSLTIPRTWGAPGAVYVRGADGRLVPLAAGAPVVVRPGESVTVQVVPTAPPAAVTSGPAAPADPPTDTGNPDPAAPRP